VSPGTLAVSEAPPSTAPWRGGDIPLLDSVLRDATHITVGEQDRESPVLEVPRPVGRIRYVRAAIQDNDEEVAPEAPPPPLAADIDPALLAEVIDTLFSMQDDNAGQPRPSSVWMVEWR
jgi:hypothetical protein